MDSNDHPFLGLHPGFAVPPSVSANQNLGAAMRTRRWLPVWHSFGCRRVHSSLPSARPLSIVAAE